MKLTFLMKIVFQLLIFSQIQMIGSVLVSVGKYSKYRKYDINLAECGLKFKPIKHRIIFNKKCFKQKFDNKTVWDYNIRQYQTQQKVNSSDTPLKRVFGGIKVDYAESPWTVYIELPLDETIYRACTGVLITFEWLLTAAHCYIEAQTNFDIKLGTDFYNIIEERHSDKSKFFRPPLYVNSSGNGTELFYNDIGLIKLNTPFTKHLSIGRRYLINTICLPKRKQEFNYDLESATYYGWGNYEEGKDNLFLRKQEVRIQPMEGCFNAKMVCALYSSEDHSRPCDGDSGGPLIQFVGKELRAVLVGTLRSVAPGNVSCSQIRKSFWVSVPKFINWILETIEQN